MESGRRAGAEGPGQGPWVGPELASAARSAARVGLFGGSFDPVHRGHLTVVRAALASAGLDHLVLVPARVSPHKLGDPPAPGRTRAELLHTALESLSEALQEQVSIWTVELERPGPSFTIDTVREFERRRPAGAPRPRLVLGQDSLEGLPRWHERDSLLERVELVIVERGGAEPRDQALGRLAGHLPDDVLARLEAGWVSLERPSEASSTALRSGLARGSGAQPDLPAAVAERIRREGLYGHGADGSGADS